MKFKEAQVKRIISICWYSRFRAIRFWCSLSSFWISFQEMSCLWLRGTHTRIRKLGIVYICNGYFDNLSRDELFIVGSNVIYVMYIWSWLFSWVRFLYWCSFSFRAWAFSLAHPPARLWVLFSAFLLFWWFYVRSGLRPPDFVPGKQTFGVVLVLHNGVGLVNRYASP